MDKVYVLHKLSHESQCDSEDDWFELFESRKDAENKLAEQREAVEKLDEYVKETHWDGRALKWTCGDFYNEWWVEEQEVRPREKEESGIVEHARSELELLERGLDGDALEMQKLVDGAILDLMKVFAEQGHSGFSAKYALDAFCRLADWKPVSALTGEDDEWGEEVDRERHTQHNRRYPALFRENHDNSTAHCVDSVIFSDDGGLSWFSCGWMRKMYERPIEFPWMPPSGPRCVYIKWTDEDNRKFVDVTDSEDTKRELREKKEKEMKERARK